MESLDSTLESKRPAAALNLLSQHRKPQVAISSEGQYQTSISVFALTNYFPGSVAEWLGRWTRNSEVVGSSPALTTKLELFLGRS